MRTAGEYARVKQFTDELERAEQKSGMGSGSDASAQNFRIG